MQRNYNYGPGKRGRKTLRPSAGDSGLRSALPAASNDDTNWWMITLSDLTILLLGFMVVWYFIGNAKQTIATASNAAQRSPKKRQTAHAVAQPKSNSEVWTNMRGELLGFVNAAGFADDVTIESMPNEIVLSLRDTITFASGKTELRPRALPVLEKVVAIVMRDASLSAAISGHTDSVRIATPEFPSNWELSGARASRVARYLVERGVHPNRISVEGYASFRPRRPNSNPQNRSLNRRVEIRLSHDADAAPDPDAADLANDHRS